MLRPIAVSLVWLMAGPVWAEDAKLPPPATASIDFVRDVQPIFKTACYSCHGPEKQKSGYRLDSRTIALAGGDIGPAVIIGKSAESPLIHYVGGLNEDLLMPATGERLTAQQVGILRAWIDQGAMWPDSADNKELNQPLWSLAPLVKPATPVVKDAQHVLTPIDAFILAQLEARGMTLSPPADRRTLLRRVTFDLIGLPPTPQEMDTFLADESPEAFERVVDRLLASPRYGERWARHWMDVVHFAETHGNDQDRPRPNAWPYRDYLIQAFNADKPYARFIQDQLAGDVLFPDDPLAVAATGFIATGPWDESSLQSIQDDTLDRKIARNLDRDDMLTTTTSTFLSMTVHCARCHNHKFDPITQQEYYQLQSVFAGVERGDRPFEPDPQVAARRGALLKRQAELKNPAVDLTASLADSALIARVAAWEKDLAAKAVNWTVLDPDNFTSSGGATPTKQGDLSILFGGTRPDKDTYTITAKTALQGITAVRVELLLDDSLPHKGPGRQDNGNLHLNELKLLAAPLSDPSAASPAPLHKPSADFNQDGWSIDRAIDGNPGTAWGIYPAVGKPHVGVFELKAPAGFDGGTQLSFVLEQTHGQGHLIGRVRVSVSTSPPPVSTVALPPDLAALLVVPRAERTPAQNIELARRYLLDEAERELAALPPVQMVYAAIGDVKLPGAAAAALALRPIHVLKRGDVSMPGELVTPAALACVPSLNPQFETAAATDGGRRRAALATWISDPRNVLTWRSIVNRVWHYHLGRGIADSPNDLGRMGVPPTHPELIDWLAATLLENGGSLKRLHRVIVTSAVYRQSSAHQPQFAAIDGANQYLWRMNRSRLDAESVRDAVLQVTGKLDLTMGGPSVKQFIESPGIHVTPNVDYAHFDVDSPANYRRSVYRFLFRTLPDPFMDTMDCADSSQLISKRSSSVSALQALSMLNNKFIVRQSEHFADRVSKLGADLPAQIAAAYRLALNREPTPSESQALVEYATRFGLPNACRLIFNSNEFMFVN